MNIRRLVAASALVATIAAPVFASSPNYCIKVNGGFGAPNFGTTFVGRGFAMPAEGSCAPWSGFTKTATTVVLITNGVGCLSSNGKVLTVSVSSADPAFFGTGGIGSGGFGVDYIQLCPEGVSGCPIEGSDQGALGFGGAAEPETCTSSLLNLPATHE